MPPAKPSDLEKFPELQKEFVKLLSSGVTITSACKSLSVDRSTYYLWLKRGRAEIARREKPNVKLDTGKTQREQLYVDFVLAMERAEAAARVHATAIFVHGMMPSEEVTDTEKTITETRLNPKTGQTYTYTRTERVKSTRKLPGDWRAGLEFIKRREKEEWSDKLGTGEDINISASKPIPITVVEIQKTYVRAEHEETETERMEFPGVNIGRSHPNNN